MHHFKKALGEMNDLNANFCEEISATIEIRKKIMLCLHVGIEIEIIQHKFSI